MDKKYFLGLDIGTNSVGFSITDNNYNLLKANGKELWGIRLFEEGETASETRVFRSNRRRNDRKKQRIDLLQELFSEEINKVDDTFFLRLNESKFLKEDKSINQSNTLFNDISFKDVDYHKKYPTIYHLRKALINNEKLDIRLVYLAIEHIIKYRGHFLFEGQKLNSVMDFKNTFEEFSELIKDKFDLDFYLNNEEMESVKNILKSKNITKTEKNKQLKNIFNYKDDISKSIIGLLSGSVVKLEKLFLDIDFSNSEIKKVCFSDSSFDENYIKLQELLLENIIVLDKIKTLYDWGILNEILNNEKSISSAKVISYEKHKYDLKILKKVIRKYHNEEYENIFKNENINNNYVSYIKMNKRNNKKVEINKKCSKEDLCKYLSNIFKNDNYDDKEFQYILKEIESSTLLPKQKDKNNGVIPYQVHLNELEIILDNISKQYNFFNIKEGKYSIKDKILKIFLFKIPYYIGPLNNYHEKIGGNSWIIKKQNTKIYPWNFEEIVDIEKSAEKFIKRMTNKCTYLIGKDVIPKNSILYSEYLVYNELNNIKINNEKLPINIKQEIVNDLFKLNKKVTLKRIKNYLISRGFDKDILISGIDDDLKSSLASYIDLNKILENYYTDNIAEDIIKWITLYSDDKNLLRNQISKLYNFDENIINKIVLLKYTGWARFSRELLTEVEGVNKETGEIFNIINALKNTNNNFMELLSYRYSFLEEIEKRNKNINDKIDKIDYSLVDSLYVSPSVKRALWQTLLIVEEITKIMKCKPNKIFIEVTRKNEERKRTESRKEKIKRLYNNCKEESRDLMKILETKDDSSLRSKKLYLYFKQLGRCMYTNKIIDLDYLLNDNIYDIDHIYPQSKVKDDSFDNMVLVLKEANAKKTDIYPIPKEYRQVDLWTSLYKKELISKRKYERLIRKTSLTNDELASFINRQLVETSQSSKATAEILNKLYEDTEIIYSKAGNVSDFRHKFELFKNREINDYHHAKDAYLNIVVGNTYHTKFTSNPINFLNKSNERGYNIKRLFEFDVKRNDNIAWIKGEKGTISTVKKIMRKNNVLFTRYSYEEKGKFFDENIVKKGKNDNLIPIKLSDKRFLDTKKYGGYNSVKGSYFFIIEHMDEKKNKLVKTIEYMPIYLKHKIKSNNDLLEYCKNNLNLRQVRVLVSKVKINTLFNLDGFRMHISGRTGNQIVFKGAMQLVLNQDKEEYLRKVLKYVEKINKIGKELKIIENDKITKQDNSEIYDIFINKLKNTNYNVLLSAQINNLESGKEVFKKLTIEEQCKALYNILPLFKCNAVKANLKLINGSSSAGTILISKNITDKNIKIINQSVTGVFSNTINVSEL